MKITVTVKEIMEDGNWDKFCELKGLSPWAVNEGLPENTKYELTLEEAIKCRILEDDIQNHICTGEPPY